MPTAVYHHREVGRVVSAIRIICVRNISAKVVGEFNTLLECHSIDLFPIC